MIQIIDQYVDQDKLPEGDDEDEFGEAADGDEGDDEEDMDLSLGDGDEEGDYTDDAEVEEMVSLSRGILLFLWVFFFVLTTTPTPPPHTVQRYCQGQEDHHQGRPLQVGRAAGAHRLGALHQGERRHLR